MSKEQNGLIQKHFTDWLTNFDPRPAERHGNYSSYEAGWQAALRVFQVDKLRQDNITLHKHLYGK